MLGVLLGRCTSRHMASSTCLHRSRYIQITVLTVRAGGGLRTRVEATPRYWKTSLVPTSMRAQREIAEAGRRDGYVEERELEDEGRELLDAGFHGETCSDLRLISFAVSRDRPPPGLQALVYPNRRVHARRVEACISGQRPSTANAGHTSQPRSASFPRRTYSRAPTTSSRIRSSVEELLARFDVPCPSPTSEAERRPSRAGTSLSFARAVQRDARFARPLRAPFSF